MYPVLIMTHMLDILDSFNMGATMGFFIHGSYEINRTFVMEFRQKSSNISSFKKLSNALRL